MLDIKNILKENAELTERALREYFREDDADFGIVLEAERYSLLSGGKRIRASLVIEFCKLFGGNVSDAVPLASAIEMIHASSLIHDDLPCMDDDDLRRGKPTSHKVFGYANALLAGDALLIRAFETISSSHLSDKAVRHATLALSCAAGDFGMIGGQVIDLRGEKEELSYETLMKLHRKKTGALIRCAALLGCIAAGLEWNDERTQAACEYAEKIGLAFQIVDDILDVTGDEALLGKDIGSDAEGGKTTFMSFFSPDEAYEKARELTDGAIDELDGYESSQTLIELARFLLDRRY